MKYIVSIEGKKVMSSYICIIDDTKKETLAKVITLANKKYEEYNLKFNEFTKGRFGSLISLSNLMYGAYLSIIEAPVLEELED